MATAQRTSRTDEVVRRTGETQKTFRQLAEELKQKRGLHRSEYSSSTLRGHLAAGPATGR